ncbi:hypothetical protein PV328_006416 [Microctonus aethiopoides]|uniref:SET and MYND domain-containing protein 4 n=1 Tax=Microctonus aethiopoides TaxID=144406 RepID=A0AA39FP99_9HYME|nr:hypothetical protein PV328_006416 [Microctonus aethiopoides]
MDDLCDLLDLFIMEFIISPRLALYNYSAQMDDEEKIKVALRHLSTCGKHVDNQKNGKSKFRALAYIEEGNKKFESLFREDLLEIYTKAAMYAEIGSNELARAYGNRSAHLYTSGLYEDALIDIERALAIGYNDDTKTKLYVRRAKCLFVLKKEMSPEIEEALSDARKWLDKMKEADKKYMTKILDKFPEGLLNKTPFKKYDYNALLPEPPQDNPKIPGASGAIELKYSDQFGRHVVATRDINAGETIIVHRSYATVIDSKFSHKYCWNCCKRAWSGVPCHKCVEVIYCNETCRDKAWSEHHEIECKVISVITREKLDIYDLLALRLTAKAYKEAGSLKKLQEKIRKIDSIDDPILKCLTNNRFDHTKYESVYSLWRHNTIDSDTALRLSLILCSLAATTNIFGEKILNSKQLLNNEEATFIGRLMLVNHEIASMNASKFSGDNNAGLALDPLWSLFNHSCDPETINMTPGNIMSLTAFQRLEKGQQVCINYDEPFFFAYIPNRRLLHKKFRFECECRACKECWAPDFFLKFPHCEAYTPAALMKKLGLSSIFGEFKKFGDMVNANDDTKVVLIPDLFRVLDFYLRVYGYPRVEIIEIKLILVHISSALSHKY